MSKQKLIIGGRDSITVTCPECRHTKKIPVYSLIKRSFKARCTCGNLFEVEVEGRKKFRKKTELDGFFEKFHHQEGEKFPVVHWETTFVHFKKPNCLIENISMNGIGFKTLVAHELSVNDYVRLKTRLDDSAKTLIERNLLVRFVRNNYIGCMVLESGGQDNKLAWYMLS
ncbi:MAG: hypothetical protein KKE17_12040 [Proteobacteria bacterium]|nr:hypothetical protein [Pseudomonadota bacterium]MBU1710727.1 hypothetical protein [Pseudomonadota bacterium]